MSVCSPGQVREQAGRPQGTIPKKTTLARAAWLRIPLLREVKSVEGSMDEWREDHGSGRDERDAAVDGVTAGKQFSGTRFQRRERTFAGEEHRGVEKRIEPRQTFEQAITNR